MEMCWRNGVEPREAMALRVRFRQWSTDGVCWIGCTAPLKKRGERYYRQSDFDWHGATGFVMSFSDSGRLDCHICQTQTLSNLCLTYLTIALNDQNSTRPQYAIQIIHCYLYMIYLSENSKSSLTYVFIGW